MLPSLKEALDEMAELKKEAGDLKIIIHQELKEAPEDSIEVMAIQSEILQIDQDIEELKGHLIQIEQTLRMFYRKQIWFYVKNSLSTMRPVIFRPGLSG